VIDLIVAKLEVVVSCEEFKAIQYGTEALQEFPTQFRRQMDIQDAMNILIDHFKGETPESVELYKAMTLLERRAQDALLALRSRDWSAEFLSNVQKHVRLNSSSNMNHSLCEVCKRPGRISSSKISFEGNGNETSPLEIGKHCLERVSKYHALYHWKLKMERLAKSHGVAWRMTEEFEELLNSATKFVALH
jgi:hypothetical protein